MPTRALRLCRKHGPVAGRCPACERARQQRSEAQRPTSAQRLYGRKWREAVAGYVKAHPWCALCAREGRSTPSATIDHIVAHKGDAGLFWDRQNWQPACLSCNSRKAARDEGGFGNRAAAKRDRLASRDGTRG